LHDYQPGSILRRAGKITNTDARLSLQQAQPQFEHFSGSSRGVFMARQIVFTSKAAKPSPTYSQAVKAAGLVFVLAQR
jgi:hypothetical protein